MKLPKIYEPQQYEPTAYALWESSGAFKPRGQGVPYSIVMPPPNANGNLHIGHALDMNLKDILIRFERMRGKDAIFIPGADHAGFETWVVYEKQLATEGKDRFLFSREELYSQVWDFVAARRGDMELQLRALGISASWDDMVFTLDEKVVETVYETFKKLWDDGLIYRKKRLVNYCTKHRTSFADIEVVYEDIARPLYYLKYGPFELATTRPETKFGDTAVAVHPEDERYAAYVGKEIDVEGLDGPFKLKVVADEMVDREFGTGAVKITPAHDFNDAEVAERHNLPAIEVIDHTGHLTDVAGKYAGMSVNDARQAVVRDLQEKGLLVRIDDNYQTRVAKCYKCGTDIEPLLKEQWFLNVRPLADRAKQALEQGDTSFTPTSKQKEVAAYLDGLRDWNLSRQIPWGIAIPAFQNVDDPEDWVFDTRIEEETITVDGKTYKRDEDTFDTWFSSGQWPFIVTDALQEGSELSRFFPTTLMETGGDLLRQWVSRMIMLSLYRTEKVPFENVYFHGMVNDEKNQKMSKSKGNVINPMEMVDAYGSDALRLGIIANRTAAQNQAFSKASVVAGRNFCNKLWNMARFVEDHIADVEVNTPVAETIADHWVLSRLDTARQQIEQHLENYRFAEASDVMYHTIWDDVADWYIEASKQTLNPSVMSWVIETCLKLAHPFAPFVTETIWTTLERSTTPLISTPWPESIAYDEIAAGEFEQLKALVGEVRYVSGELPGGKQTLIYENDSLIDDNADLIARLARLEAVQRVESPKGLRLAVPNREAWLDVSQDVLYEHQTKLEVRLADVRKRLEALENRLANKSYVDNAPKHLVEETERELKEQEQLFKRLSSELEVL